MGTLPLYSASLATHTCVCVHACMYMHECTYARVQKVRSGARPHWCTQCLACQIRTVVAPWGVFPGGRQGQGLGDPALFLRASVSASVNEGNS